MPSPVLTLGKAESHRSVGGEFPFVAGSIRVNARFDQHHHGRQAITTAAKPSPRSPRQERHLLAEIFATLGGVGSARIGTRPFLAGGLLLMGTGFGWFGLIIRADVS
ncbi:MAG: hypothetical protein ABSA02_25375 [Trebonia sp.]